MRTQLSTENGLSTIPRHIHGFALMHVAMRRDARRLVAGAAGVRDGQVDRVAGWWRQVRAVIDWHHHTEDDILWPALRAKSPVFAEREQAMHADHIALDEAMEAVTKALAPGRLLDLAGAARRFDTVVHAHLRDEEAVVLSAFRDDLSEREYLAIERRVIASAPMSVMAFLPPWMLDGADGVGASSMPPPVRLLGTTVLRLRYHRQWRWW
ncbi:Hemerythrin HHE cation binding domain-containing protein [Actinokineospora alba]|uniref:Hemerythrin HHE cation binding domain-containing protein n=1 Tax=Actinokineospora alba TaxID=504798 RepID=A0A1H0M5J6_9PSEU|nr:hemerythrin domain-containing protein [Actinokineospora alba]TDP67595.1 hemerythrin HHE cation binding domain-containing protein [Actinokineospora alba]SDI44835.1 Hemerythrin HHE cation binding domain-containing protein [Actinokineospora alba]SDO75729.1 Hemerythrin HHE cation binding domain-containing protein [Actinokineospora alba]